ncbi:DNA-directed RNA polymerase I subunit rpa43 isoform X1 [Typha latifolia]|uniref:DNA-directed RNA polymerase I subunit rpa43 isoform X1 n=2 Tax=Typha latifolia TaxID=4733 RepID=UPI003C2CE072
MEGLSVAKADLTVYVHPSKANKVDQAVRRQLSSLLFTYNELFDGVILAHEFNFKSKHAKILPGLIPYFGVNVKAKLLVFSPRPDMLLEGKVVKLGKESIHVIVLGFCSAAIMMEDIRQEFKYKIKGGFGTFVSLAHKRHVIKAGSMIRFLVKSVDEEILHLSGSLIPSNTGCIRWLSKHGGDGASQINRSIKRPRGSDFVMGLQDQHSRLFDNIDQSQNLSRPHKARKRTAE